LVFDPCGIAGSGLSTGFGASGAVFFLPRGAGGLSSAQGSGLSVSAQSAFDGELLRQGCAKDRAAIAGGGDVRSDRIGSPPRPAFRGLEETHSVQGFPPKYRRSSPTSNISGILEGGIHR